MVVIPLGYNALITSCEKGRQWQLALVVLAAMGNKADVFSFSAAISACEKCGRWQIALQLFENMATARVTADEIGFNAAISACEKGGQWPSAVQLLQLLATRRCVATVVSFSAAISAGAAGAEWLAALCMLESMQTQVKSNEVTFNALLSCCETSQWRHGLSLADAMRHVKLLPDVVTLSTSISTLGSGRWPRALSSFQSFSTTSGVNLVSFNAMIHACESQWPLALELFTELGSPDVVSFGTVAAALCRGAKLKEAVQFLKQMTGADLRIDLVSFNASMTSCQAVGRWQEAFFLLDFMLQVQVSPDVTSLSSLVTSAAKASRWRMALQGFEDRKTMNRVGFCAAINACEKGQRWSEAIQLLQILRQRQEADVPSFNAVLSCLEKGGRWRQALQLFQDMVEADLRPNDISFNSLISACEGRWFLALHLLEAMPRHGVAGDVISFSAVLRSLEKAGRWRDAVRLLDGMKGASVQPNAITFEATVLACERAWQPFHALRLFFLQSMAMGTLEARAPVPATVLSREAGIPGGILAGALDLLGEDTHWFAVYRPASRDAIAKMLSGIAVGKGLNVKGKSAKLNRLSGFVPFLQISQESDKADVTPSPSDARTTIYFASGELRQRAAGHLQSLMESEDLEIEDPRIIPLDAYPATPGLNVPEPLLRFAFIDKPDIQPAVGWETGRISSPAFMDMNLQAVRGDSKPQVVLFQYDQDNALNPHGLLIAYAETTVKPAGEPEGTVLQEAPGHNLTTTVTPSENSQEFMTIL
eukprot:s2612_g6.t3